MTSEIKIYCHLPLFRKALYALTLIFALLVTVQPAASSETAWLPTVVVLPFRELGSFPGIDGMLASELLITQLSTAGEFRLISHDANIDIVREVEIGLLCGQAGACPQRDGVDGVVTGDIFVHHDKLVLSLKCISLSDETVHGAWVETTASEGITHALDLLLERFTPKLNGWVNASQRRYQQNQRQDISELSTLAGRQIEIIIEESFTREHALMTGVAAGAVMEACTQARMGVIDGNKHYPSGTNDHLVLKGSAACDEPVFRDGKAVVTASCRLTLMMGGTLLADETVRRTYAAGLARDAAQAALESSGRDALSRVFETLMAHLGEPSASCEGMSKLAGDPAAIIPTTAVCLEIDIPDNPLLVANREVLLLRLASETGIRPMIRSPYDPAQPFAAKSGPSVAELRHPAHYSIILSHRTGAIECRILDNQSGTLIAALQLADSTGIIETVDQQSSLFLKAIDIRDTLETTPARWFRTSKTPIIHPLLLKHAASVLPDEYAHILNQEQGLGLDSFRFATDITLTNEAFSGREQGREGTRMRLMAIDVEGALIGEYTVFLAEGDDFTEHQRLLEKAVVPLLELASLRLSKRTDAPPVQIIPNSVLGLAKAEAESQMVVDWYRVNDGHGDDDAIQSLEILTRRSGWAGQRSGQKTWHGPATRAATARLRWEVANQRTRDQRANDRWLLYDAWANWQEVPRHDADALTDAYLRAYCPLIQGDGSLIASDLPLVFMVTQTGHFSGIPQWNGQIDIPTFRQDDFRRALVRSENPSIRKLALTEWDMLRNIWRRDATPPESHADALIKALSTTNSLSQLLLQNLAAEKPGVDKRILNDEARLIDAVVGSVWSCIESMSHESFNETHKGNLHYRRSSAAFHKSLHDYLDQTAPPLPPLIREAASRLVNTTRGRQFGLRDALRKHEHIPSPPSHVGQPPTPSNAPPQALEWPLEWIPCPLKNLPRTGSQLLWVSEGTIFQGHLDGSRLRTIWCNTQSARWGDSIDALSSLETASDIRTFDGYSLYGRNTQWCLASNWRSYTFALDGSITNTSGSPVRGRWDMLLDTHEGVIFAKNAESRLVYWNHRDDSVYDLANYGSTAPGVLNNQHRWTVCGLHAGPITGTVDVLISAMVKPENASGSIPEVRHATIDWRSGAGQVIRRQRTNINNAMGKTLSFTDYLLVQQGATWTLWPRAPERSIVPLPDCAEAAFIAVSANQTRLFANRSTTGMKDHFTLSIYDGLTTDSPRHTTLWGSRFQAPLLLRVGDDLVIMDSHRQLKTGILLLRDAFTRELPADTTNIQLRESVY